MLGAVQAFPPKPFPKLPATLFRDLRPRGGLFHIAATCLRQQQAHQLKKLDFASPANRKLVTSGPRSSLTSHICWGTQHPAPSCRAKSRCRH